MERAKDDDEEDHLEEGDKDVGGGDHQTNHTQDCRYGALVHLQVIGDIRS